MAALSQRGDHDAAISKIEHIQATSREIGTLPSVLNSLGVEYLAAGRTAQARQAFEESLKKDPTNKTAWAGLGELPDGRLTSLRIVNFSSEWFWTSGASNLVDGDPSSGWMSANGTFPQSFVIELPVESSISEISFNNAPSGDPNQAAKDIEVSLSSDSATAGFEVAAKAVLAQGEIGQGTRITPAKRARWIKLRILSNYGNPDYTELGNVEVIGRPHPG